MVIMTPTEGLRFGNWLYLWLSAHERSNAGNLTRVLEVPRMEPWLAAFPELRRLTISSAVMRFRDRRGWDHASWNQHFGVEFTRSTLNSFIEDCIVDAIEPDATGSLVMNIRRGNYYTDPDLRARYAFDQVGYLTAALAHFGEIQQLVVVSDDPQWCRDNLADMLRGKCDALVFADAEPLANFRTVARASCIIGTNSTFSYWGAYIAGVLHKHPVIVMPRFHARFAPGKTDAYHLDPRWTAIEGFY